MGDLPETAQRRIESLARTYNRDDLTGNVATGGARVLSSLRDQYGTGAVDAALSDALDGSDSPDQRHGRAGGGGRGNTVWFEAVFEQGRRVQGSDVTEIADWIEEQIITWAESAAYRPNIRRRDVWTVAGADRPDDAEFFGVSAENRIHVFIRAPDDEVPIEQGGGLRKNVADSFHGDGIVQKTPPDAAIGRGFSNFNIVDPAVVERSIPELAGPPREDVEFL